MLAFSFSSTLFTVLLICTTDNEVCRLRNMFCKIKYIVFQIKILTVLLLCRSFVKQNNSILINKSLFFNLIAI